MSHHLWILACILLFGGTPRTALAQDSPDASQVRYIEELKQRNANYGPGCDGIGISVPAELDMPADITDRWAAGHSACIPGMRLVMTCTGEVAGEVRIIGCIFQVADGQADGTITCEQFTLIAPGARFTPDPMLSDALGGGSETAVRPCSDAGGFSAGVTIGAAFLVPASESVADLALMIDVDGSEVPAFLIPAGQLSVAAPADS